MRTALLSIALVVLVGQCWADDDKEETNGGIFGGRFAGALEPRLAANALRIYDLEQHIEKLKTRIEEAEQADPQRFFNDIKYRLDTLEGTHCDEHEFQCGNNGQECISDLFVCDGHKDCHNGHDEDESVCHPEAVKAGKSFSGITHWTDCLQLADHTSHLTIIGTRRAHFFSSRVGVQAYVTAVTKSEDGQEKKTYYEMNGGFNFANRRLYLIPKHEYGQVNFALNCTFDHGDWERLDCTTETELSQHVCAESHLTLQHHGDDDDDDDHHDDHHGDHHDDHDDEHENYFDRLFKRGHDLDEDDDHDDAEHHH